MEEIITEEQFLADVKHEVETLKKLATKEEINNLSIQFLNPDNVSNCIYGQMTGHCRSNRALKLISKACVRMANTNKAKFKDKTFLEIENAIEGPYNSKKFNDTWYLHYFSMLEVYIYLKDNKNVNIIKYLKDEIQTLEL